MEVFRRRAPFQAIRPVSAASALLLSSTDQLQYVPDGTNTETATITYRAWDTTSGVDGGRADLLASTAYGGTTAFSSTTDTATVAVTAVTKPSGYTITADETSITSSNAASTGFTFVGATVGDTYTYTVTSSGSGGTPVPGTATVTSATQDVTPINVASLPNGTLTYSVTLSNSAGTGAAATTTATLDQTTPSGYTITADETTITPSNASSAGFTFAGATVGDTYTYSVTSSGSGGTPVTGTGT